MSAVETEPVTQRRESLLPKTVRDMVLSMGVIGAVVAVIVVINWQPSPEPVKALDSAPVAEAVAAAVDYDVLHPQLAEGWRATSARFEPTAETGDEPVWFNGWVTPEGEYAAVVQSTATNSGFVEEQTVGGLPITDRAVLPAGTEAWQAYVTRDGNQRSLVRQTDGVTTIVTGTVEWPALVEFEDSLRVVDPNS